MGRILITGGAGFIGSNFIRYFLRKHPGAEIVNLDKLTYAGNLKNLTSVANDDRYRFVKGSICDAGLLDQLFSEHEIDRVINFAAESHVDRSILGGEVFVETNVGGVQTLLDVARNHGVERFVQISTDEVYGDLGAEGSFTEETPLAPNSPYSASKAGADMLCRAHHQTYGLPVVITRCSNNYGPYQFPEKLIPLMIYRATRDEKLPVYGDGANVRDWIHVSDHCTAVDLVLSSGKVGEVYNIGGHGERANIDVVRVILNALGKPESLIEFVTDRPGHDRRYAMDASKIEHELEWRPEHAFEQGLAETIDWYARNGDWVESCISGEYQRYYETLYGNR